MSNSEYYLISLELTELIAQSPNNESDWFEVRLMIQNAVRRGRPKGTGIDDTERLARIGELLRIHPELRPTTAIRQMGYSDPSAIRRLRDKYKIFALTGETSFLKGFVPSSNAGSSEQKRTPAASIETR
ncbi:hypothetical protein [Hyphomicrobium methylovorum]|uniref:hypothetical protein n=1 Tax=Hyphomicrobium methylovorum TaxID=84 RepID=UPI001FEBC412|nr:hypothetical protein [Hyphomicrobium methylovorum]